MVAYTFDPQAYQTTVHISNNGVASSIDIYGYLGHLVTFNFIPPPYPLQFYGVIYGGSPEQYGFFCFTNQIHLYMEQVAMLQQPGPKHISIEADSVIPSAGQVNIPITGFIITTDFLPTGIAQIQAQTMPAELIRMVPEEFRKLIEDRERSLKELFGRVTG